MSTAKKLVLHKKFNHSASWIYKVFTDANYMKIWWSNETVIVSDAVVGGNWKIVRPYEGVDFITLGKYTALIPNQKIVYTYSMPDFSLHEDVVTITITETGHDACEITLEQEGKDIAAELEALEDGDVSESEQGWNIAFELIESNM